MLSIYEEDGIYGVASSDISTGEFKTTSFTASKASLLDEISKISPKEILAFGDDFNDIEMLKLCGKGITMGNAIAQVKEVSDYVHRGFGKNRDRPRFCVFFIKKSYFFV